MSALIDAALLRLAGARAWGPAQDRALHAAGTRRTAASDAESNGLQPRRRAGEVPVEEPGQVVAGETCVVGTMSLCPTSVGIRTGKIRHGVTCARGKSCGGPRHDGRVALLFSYGTLRLALVQEAVFGRQVQGEPDAIAGHVLDQIVITDPEVIAASGSTVQPVLVPSENATAEVDGTVFDLSEAEVAAADDYVADAYQRMSFPLRSGRTAWVYVLVDPPAERPSQRHADGSAGDADYGAIGQDYTRYRQPEPAIAAQIEAALGDARTVVNVGAGAGSYEPSDRDVTPVEPSASMRAQRAGGHAPAVDATAEQLPFPDRAFDAAMATFTIHQWTDLAAGLAEMQRVSRGSIVILTCDPILLERFWLIEYAPEVIAVEAGRYPGIDTIAECLGAGSADVEVRPVAIPWACVDGFGEAYYGRPERLLDPGARTANSAWSFVGPEIHERFVRDLGRALADGSWDARWGNLREQETFEGSLVLVIARGRAGS